MAKRIQPCIYEESYQTKSGTQIKYRVRISRKEIKVDEYFDTLEQAKQFFHKVKSGELKNGEEYHAFQKKEELRLQDSREENYNPKLGVYINRYYKSLFPTLPDKNNFLDRKRALTIRSLLNTIIKTPVPNKLYWKTLVKKMGDIGSFLPFKVMPFGEFRLTQIDHIAVNNYIEERLKTIKRNSCQREISLISSVLEWIQHNDVQAWDNLGKTNHAREFNKKLLKKEYKPVVTIKRDEFAKIIEAYSSILDRDSVEQHFEIFTLCCFTAMRRAELLNLTWEQVKIDDEDFPKISLIRTKSGRPRDVYLDHNAIITLKSIPKRDPVKVWTISYAYFEKQWQRFQQDFGISVTFHTVRKYAISKILKRYFNGDNKQSPLLAATHLGFANIKQFEASYMDKNKQGFDTEEGILNTIAHETTQTTSDHYFNIEQD
jgi:integrase